MEKKRNNPWYYYLNGKLVKKRKPAMPGDVVLISKPYDAGCKFTVVGEVYIGGFHDQYRKYYPWDEVFRASDVLDELTDLRNFKNHYEYSANPIISDLQDQIEKLKGDLEFAWLQTGKATAELKDFKNAVYDQLFHGSVWVWDEEINQSTFNVYRHIYNYMKDNGFNVEKCDICNIDANFGLSECEVKFKFVHYSVKSAETEPYHYIKFQKYS